MSADEVYQAIAIELKAVVPAGWSVKRGPTSVVVHAVADAELRDHVWAIARFIAYDDHVAIDRIPGPVVGYVIRSTSGRGLSFEVPIIAV